MKKLERTERPPHGTIMTYYDAMTFIYVARKDRAATFQRLMELRGSGCPPIPASTPASWTSVRPEILPIALLLLALFLLLVMLVMLVMLVLLREGYNRRKKAVEEVDDDADNVWLPLPPYTPTETSGCLTETATPTETETETDTGEPTETETETETGEPTESETERESETCEEDEAREEELLRLHEELNACKEENRALREALEGRTALLRQAEDALIA